MKVSVDVGGTFTDLVLDDGTGLSLHKSATVPDAPERSVLAVLERAADARSVALDELLADVELFMHATTRGLNAVLTRTTARTAFLTTEGHPDVLLLREGGRADPFDFTVPFPEPFVPRARTFEVPGRITSDGSVLEPLSDRELDVVLDRVADAEVEAVGVCLLWSTANPVHELQVASALERRLPGVPYTLSHQLNPTLREYRRASSTCIDAALKPLMTEYLHGLSEALHARGFRGRFLVVTSIGGVMDVDHVIAAPIHSINSGPSMAPVAGREFTRADGADDVVIVADAGGTTYDVTLVRDGHIPWTRETWIGPPLLGHMTGFPSVDVKSVGAGGGSIAWVDDGGLLHVGPQSAGARPGPVCYGQGGTRATVTDAALVLGYLDPARFADGGMRLESEPAARALGADVADPLGLPDAAAGADAVMRLVTEQMVRAIEEITLQQGVDPAGATLVGGGGAAGLNAVAVARRLGCARVIVPGVGAALAAAGAVISDLLTSYAITLPTSTDDFDVVAVNEVLASLRARADAFIARAGTDPGAATIELFAEARYPQQVWDLELPLRAARVRDDADVAALVADFHALHERVLGVSDPRSAVEILTWGARVHCPLGRQRLLAPGPLAPAGPAGEREVRFGEQGRLSTRVCALEKIASDEIVEGPALIECPFTTVVIPPGGAARRDALGSLLVDPVWSPAAERSKAAVS